MIRLGLGMAILASILAWVTLKPGGGAPSDSPANDEEEAPVVSTAELPQDTFCYIRLGRSGVDEVEFVASPKHSRRFHDLLHYVSALEGAPDVTVISGDPDDMDVALSLDAIHFVRPDGTDPGATIARVHIRLTGRLWTFYVWRADTPGGGRIFQFPQHDKIQRLMSAVKRLAILDDLIEDLGCDILTVRQGAVGSLVSAYSSPPTGFFSAGRDRTVTALRKCLRDASPTMRSRVVAALVTLDAADAEAFAVLKQLLPMENEAVRRNCVLALSELGPRASAIIPELIEGLKGQNPSMRITYAEALSRIGPQAAPAVPALMKALRDPATWWQGREYCVTALGNIGAAAKCALPDLEQCLHDEAEAVREAAAEAIRKIRAAE